MEKKMPKITEGKGRRFLLLARLADKGVTDGGARCCVVWMEGVKSYGINKKREAACRREKTLFIS